MSRSLRARFVHDRQVGVVYMNVNVSSVRLSSVSSAYCSASVLRDFDTESIAQNATVTTVSRHC